LYRVIGEQAVLNYVRSEHRRALELGKEALSLAESGEDPYHIALGHWYLGLALFALGDFPAAHTHFEKMVVLYNSQEQPRSFVFLRGADAGVSALAYDACCLWCLGYPDQALARSQEALARAHQLDHPFSLADVLCYGGCLFNAMRRDAPRLKDYAGEMIQLATAMGFTAWLASGKCYQGEALAMLGQLEEGLAQMQAGIAGKESRGARCNLTGHLLTLAETQAKAGQLPEALVTLNETLTRVEQTDERHSEVELHRLLGELLLAQGDEAAAEASLQQALAVARRQQAKMWELRVATNLSRLWQRQGKVGEAHQLLSAVYDWFSEGFDTPDLVEAKTLLDELAG
jgi:predicted ATPase